jgi:hypothetical protein
MKLTQQGKALVPLQRIDLEREMFNRQGQIRAFQELMTLQN